MADAGPISCSFCGKAPRDQGRVVAGPGVNICDACLQVCQSLLRDESAAQRADYSRKLKVPRPHEIKAYLDDYIVGQDHTKKVLAVAVHNHYKRLVQETTFSARDPLADVEIEKSNIMLIGPTGSGKTLFARTLARLLDVPFAIADATTLTEAGYVGEDVENILLYLMQNADMDVARAEMGIVYIDEIDKIGRRTENVSITRDVSGEGVQQALLKILEGTVARVPPGGGRKHPQQEYLKINTQHILFICGGAFVDLDQIVRRREGSQAVGFGEDGVRRGHAMLHGPGSLNVEPEDLIKYGMIPELVGRIPVVSVMPELTENELVRIMVEPRNCMIRQYQKLLAMEGVKLSFTDGALRQLAGMARKRGTGARGLRAIVEAVMLDIMFEAPRNPRERDIRVTCRMLDRKLAAPAADRPGDRKIA
jgi:ATP-dependent Clp protease ATP-binding subunit ClpX